MQPQGTAATNDDVFTQLTAEVNSIDTCKELQAFVGGAFASLQAQENAIVMQLAALTPILALLVSPGASLGAIVSWITNFITAVLKPLVAPVVTLELQVAKYAAEIGQLTAAVGAAAARIGNCSVSVPALTGVPPATPPAGS